jgi:hypothetical protein
MPGHWEKVLIAPEWQPVNIAFSDSAYGFIVGNTSVSKSTARTTDCGLTWQLIFSPGVEFTRDAYHIFDLPTHEDAYYFEKGSWSFISHDSGVNWAQGNFWNNQPPMSASYN